MNTAIAMNPGHLTSSVLDIPLERIRESKTNPRRTFDETKLMELAANIKLHGVLQPILVRPLPDGEAGFYELVAGARRYRASRLAERETITIRWAVPHAARPALILRRAVRRLRLAATF